MAKARIEEAGVMNAELADRRIDRRHFGGKIRRDMHPLARGEDIELVRVENEPFVAPGDDRLPELGRRIGARQVDVDHFAVLDRAIADDLARRAFESDTQDKPVANIDLAVDQRALAVTRPKLLVGKREIRKGSVLRIAAAEAD